MGHRFPTLLTPGILQSLTGTLGGCKEGAPIVTFWTASMDPEAAYRVQDPKAAQQSIKAGLGGRNAPNGPQK